MQLSIFFLVPRKATYGNSRFFFALFALRSGLSVRLSVPLPLAPLHRSTSFKINRWWAQMDSDHRPHAYQACALTS